MMASEDSRKLSDLRVVDLRSELEKRDLDKSGNKQTLMERLQKAMESEGLNPETYAFDMEKKPATRLSTTSIQPENDTNHKDDEEAPENTSKIKADGKQSIIVSGVNKDGAFKINGDTDKLGLEKSSQKTGIEDIVTTNDPIQVHMEDGETLQDSVPNASNVVKGDMIKEISVQEDKKIATEEIEDDGAKEVQEKCEQNEENQTEVSGASSISKSSFTFAKKMSENRNLWITNISQHTRASELKQILAAYGKVIGAKVVINAKYPGACCYGYVTMETVQDAENCITKLNNTELNGQIICVEKVRPDHMIAAKMSPKLRPDGSKSDQISTPSETSCKDNTENRDSDQIQSEGVVHKPATVEESTSKHYTHTVRRSSEKKREKSSISKTTTRPDNSILTFNKIREERERQRLREKERMLRDENRRRLKEASRQREVDRLQRLEASRLERERAKLLLEREKLEKDKVDIIRLERERQKLEREKLELEKLELARVRIRLQEEDRRASKRTTSSYRREGIYDDRKRVRQYEDPPHYSNSRDTKDSHYAVRERSPHYRRDDRDHREIEGPRHSSQEGRRYSHGKDTRFDRNNTNINSWSHSRPGAPSSKVFNPASASGSGKSWNNSNRWPPSNPSRSTPSTGFAVGASMPLVGAPSALPISYSGDRFDFKSISNIRKY